MPVYFGAPSDANSLWRRWGGVIPSHPRALPCLSCRHGCHQWLQCRERGLLLLGASRAGLVQGSRAPRVEEVPVSPVSCIPRHTACQSRWGPKLYVPPVLTQAELSQSGQRLCLLLGKHYQCSSYGCKLAFHSMQELMDHLKVHYRPTQSLEGKTFHCPTLGCSETFPSMQDLMSHMKVHYKPNRYFKCENCLLRFRTHRSLFKHLHVCSDSASKAMLPGTDTAAAAAAGLHGSLEAAPLVSPATHPFPLLEPNPFGPSSLTRFSGPPHSSGPGPFVSYVHPSSYSLPQASLQHRLRPYVPGQGLPVSNAVWKKSQGETMAGCASPPRPGRVLAGHASNSRIVWEHTRGRYTCTQCPYSTASRDEMTLHIEEHRKNPPPPARLDGDVAAAGDGELPVLAALMPPGSCWANSLLRCSPPLFLSALLFASRPGQGARA
uniref:Zinc finger protein 414 n=1 Tax=Nothoprocta perdicaria TaxID=30464 RepID=A0A8C6ZNT2_NOTPE